MHSKRIYVSLRRILIAKSFLHILVARHGLVSFNNSVPTRGASSRVLYFSADIEDYFVRITVVSGIGCLCKRHC